MRTCVYVYLRFWCRNNLSRQIVPKYILFQLPKILSNQIQITSVDDLANKIMLICEMSNKTLN